MSFFLEIESAALYVLPISPSDLTRTPDPIVGLGVLVDRSSITPEERAAYDGAGLPLYCGHHLRFSDEAAAGVFEHFQTRPADLFAYRNANGMWEACGFLTSPPADRVALSS
jgi:hypothetical protein